ncbi:MAG TPA: hypothetical protein VHB77_09400 [Planctomycetaceae bacterium]|nr:hypothetical protein [Planctomycetaceae bacterium]
MSVRAQTRAWRGRLQSDQTPSGIPEIIAEVFVGEMLTRVWCGILGASGRSQLEPTLDRIARIALVEQLDVSRQILRSLIRNSARSPWDFARADKLRRQVERWTDLLLSPLMDDPGLDDFVFEADRARDFFPGSRPEIRALRCELTLAGLRTAFASFSEIVVCAPEQRAVMSAILAAFPAAAFGPAAPLHAWTDYRQHIPSLQADEPERRLRRSVLNVAALRRRSARLDGEHGALP